MFTSLTLAKLPERKRPDCSVAKALSAICGALARILHEAFGCERRKHGIFVSILEGPNLQHFQHSRFEVSCNMQVGAIIPLLPPPSNTQHSRRQPRILLKSVAVPTYVLALSHSAGPSGSPTKRAWPLAKNLKQALNISVFN